MAPDRNTDGILNHLGDYLRVREQQAVRVNPRIAHVIRDITWSQIENTRRILQKSKAFGGEKYRIGDVLVGDDELRRKAVFSMSDNNSIIPEIINRADDQQKKVAELAIHDMRTLFRAMDPSLENIVQLLQHWLLWDIPDAADLFHFDEQARRIDALLAAPISEELRARYRVGLKLPTDAPLPDDEIIKLELKRLEVVMQRFLLRRSEEEAYQSLIRRDDRPESAVNLHLAEVAKHLATLTATDNEDPAPLSAEMRAQFAELLDLPPEEVTHGRIADHERRALGEAKMSLRAALDDDHALGEPYNYKLAQAETLRERLEEKRRKVEARANQAVQAPAAELIAVLEATDAEKASAGLPGEGTATVMPEVVDDAEVAALEAAPDLVGGGAAAVPGPGGPPPLPPSLPQPAHPTPTSTTFKFQPTNF